MKALSSAQQSEVKAWEEEILACEHTLTLTQEPVITPGAGESSSMCDSVHKLTVSPIEMHLVRPDEQSMVVPHLWFGQLWTGTIWGHRREWTCFGALQGDGTRNGSQAGHNYSRGNSWRVHCKSDSLSTDVRYLLLHL